MVYAGHILYTHPLAGSVKPNEISKRTPPPSNDLFTKTRLGVKTDGAGQQGIVNELEILQNGGAEGTLQWLEFVEYSDGIGNHFPPVC